MLQSTPSAILAKYGNIWLSRSLLFIGGEDPTQQMAVAHLNRDSMSPICIAVNRRVFALHLTVSLLRSMSHMPCEENEVIMILDGV